MTTALYLFKRAIGFNGSIRSRTVYTVIDNYSKVSKENYVGNVMGDTRITIMNRTA